MNNTSGWLCVCAVYRCVCWGRCRLNTHQVDRIPPPPPACVESVRVSTILKGRCFQAVGFKCVKLLVSNMSSRWFQMCQPAPASPYVPLYHNEDMDRVTAGQVLTGKVLFWGGYYHTRTRRFGSSTKPYMITPKWSYIKRLVQHPNGRTSNVWYLGPSPIKNRASIPECTRSCMDDRVAA